MLAQQQIEQGGLTGIGQPKNIDKTGLVCIRHECVKIRANM
jgi:hypothetical protein